MNFDANIDGDLRIFAAFIPCPEGSPALFGEIPVCWSNPSVFTRQNPHFHHLNCQQFRANNGYGSSRQVIGYPNHRMVNLKHRLVNLWYPKS